MRTEKNNTSEQCIIWGAGYCGGIALEAYGTENVLCFGDSDERNVGHIRWGKEIVSYEKMLTLAKRGEIRIIAASEDYCDEMEKKLIEEKVFNYDIFKSEYARVIIADRKAGIAPLSRKYHKNVKPLVHSELERFRNVHKGKRVFLIGNGPSLVPNDLNKLHENGEICFAFNGIHAIFKKTNWRPNYYGIADFYGYMMNGVKLKYIPGIHFLWDMLQPLLGDDSTKCDYFFHYERRRYDKEMPEFSEDITKGIYLGYTSVYDIGIQFSAYMGANEIYLLGVDHDYPDKIKHDGNHFAGYFDLNETKEEKFVFYPIENTNKRYESEKATMAFEKSELYSREHGFRIFNATRGGKLEVFERVDFDRLFI